MKIKKIHIFGIFVFFLLNIFCGNGFGGEKMSAKEKDSTAEQSATLVLPIQFYQAYISRVDGNRCQMEPSCSKFCVDTVKKHGFFLGWIMCSDRLVRCGRDEEKISSPIRINNEKRIYDPVSNNDFWWQNPK